jgi:AcrR family transcriptional regulator
MDVSPRFDRHASPAAATMSAFSSFRHDFQTEHDATWQRIYDRHRGLIKVKRTNVALRNLERIITATLRISNRTSFHSMSLRDLSREADMSMGSLYTYIGSKEQLSVMILEHVLFLVDTVLTPPTGAAVTARERLRRLLRTHVYLSEVMQPWFFFAYMEAKTFDRRGRRMAIGNELRTERLIAECVAAGQAAGDFASADPTMTASLVKPLLQDWYLKCWKYQRRGTDPDSYADWVVRFVEAFLAPSEAGRGERQTSVLAG